MKSILFGIAAFAIISSGISPGKVSVPDLPAISKEACETVTDMAHGAKRQVSLFFKAMQAAVPYADSQAPGN